MRATARLLGCLVAASSASVLLPRPARGDAPTSYPLPALTLAVDGGFMSRTATWNDDLFGALRPLSLGGAPSFGGELALFPGAFVTTGRGSWLGIVARGEGIVGAGTKRSGHDDTLPTHAWAFSTSLRGRIPMWRGATWLDVGVAGRGFGVDGAGITTPDFPSVSYLGPRLGLGGEASLPAGFALSAGVGAARWVGLGDLASSAWFPHARGWGADLRLRLSWALPRGFAPYVDVAWSRDLIALRPQVGEARVAGGLADDRISVRLGLSWTLRGPIVH